MERWFAGEKRAEVSLWRGLMRLCFPLPCRSCLTSGKRARPCPQSEPDNWSKVPRSTAKGFRRRVGVQCFSHWCTVRGYILCAKLAHAKQYKAREYSANINAAQASEVPSCILSFAVGGSFQNYLPKTAASNDTREHPDSLSRARASQCESLRAY